MKHPTKVFYIVEKFKFI